MYYVMVKYTSAYIHKYLHSLYMITLNAATAIRDITENFQLGFGSFVDKRRVPYISVEPARSVNVCIVILPLNAKQV